MDIAGSAKLEIREAPGASTYNHLSQDSADLDGRVCSASSESCSLVSCLCVIMQHRKSHDFPPLLSCPGAVDAFM